MSPQLKYESSRVGEDTFLQMHDGSNVICEADRGREEVMQLELQEHGGDDRHWESTVFLAYGSPCLDLKNVCSIYNVALLSLSKKALVHISASLPCSYYFWVAVSEVT